MYNIKKLTFSDYLQWFFIYCMVGYNGMTIPLGLSYEIFQVFMFTICSFIIYFHKRQYPQLINSIFYFCCVLFIVQFLIMLVTPLTLGTVLSSIITFEVIYATYLLNSHQFLTRVTKFVALIAGLSLIIYIMTYILGFHEMVRFFSPISKVSYAAHTGDIYGWNIYVYNFVLVHQDRNCGPFGEPGQYQCILAATLFFLLFYKTNFSKKNKSYLILLIVTTLITTQSTTGYFSLIIIFTTYILYSSFLIKSDYYLRRTFKWMIVICAIFLIFTDIGNSFYERTISNKIDYQNQEIKSSGLARVISIKEAIEWISSTPTVLIGNGYDEVLTKVRSESGLLVYLLAVGILPFSILYGFLTKISFVYSPRTFIAISKILILINMSLGQPHILNPSLFLIILYPYIQKKSLL